MKKYSKFGTMMLIVVSGFFAPLQGATVLLLGDSISLNYAPKVQAVAGTNHEIFHPGNNASTSSNGLARITGWLENTGTGQWDIIHFNHGLHDIWRSPDVGGSTTTSQALYQENLRSIIAKMKEHSPQATIIFAMTTPILPQSNRLPEDVALYNNLAREVMIEQGVRINDLYSSMLPHLNEYSSDGTHFTPKGRQFNAERVVEAIDLANRYSEWAASHGLTGDDVLDTANPSGDGVVNLMKYALRLDPNFQTLGVTDGENPGLPSMNQVVDVGIFTFLKNSDALDITYMVELSDDLEAWSAVAGGMSETILENGLTKVEVSLPLNALKKFFRLRVSR